MAKKSMTLEHIDYSISRWKTRLKRAMTAIDKLEKQKKRLVKASAKPARGSSDEMPVEKPKPVSAPVPETPVARVERIDHDRDRGVVHRPPHPSEKQSFADEIPGFLRRQAAPSPVAEAIREEQAETKRLKAQGRIAKMKAKQSGETRKMPLTGKAALAAIRGQ
jgi:hypothetical protein